MKFTSRSPEPVGYSSLTWRESQKVPKVRYALRRVSLGQRIELTRRVRDLSLKYEFLRAGDTAEQTEASLADLLARRVYLEWGLCEIEGLEINGQPATAELLAEHGPEELSTEIVEDIRRELSLSNDETKNF